MELRRRPGVPWPLTEEDPRDRRCYRGASIGATERWSKVRRVRLSERGTLIRRLNYLVMARYFFHLEDGERIEDTRGHDLPDDNAALREARQIATALRLRRGRVWRVIVTNEWGHDVTESPAPVRAQG
jgi:hypothetical protein